MNAKRMTLVIAALAVAAFVAVTAVPAADSDTDVYAVQAQVDGYKYNLTESGDPAVLSAQLLNIGLKGDVTVPETVTYEGKTYTVNSIGPMKYNREITSFTAPSTITELPYMCFGSCSKLVKVDMPGVEKVRGDAFSNCSVLKDVRLGELKNVDNNMFKNCKALESVNLPGTYTKTGMSVFSGCTALKSVTLSPTATYLGGRICEKTTALETFTATGVNTVYIYAFDGSSVNTIHLGDVKEIGDGAFRNTANLKTIDFTTDGIQKVGKAAFAGTGYPDTLVLGGTLVSLPLGTGTEVVVPEGATAISGELFKGNTAITKATIAASVETIETSVFYGCSALSEVVFAPGSHLKDIDTWAFRDCTSLKGIDLPANPMTAGREPFKGCTFTDSIIVTDVTGVPALLYAATVAGQYVVDPSVKIIKYGAFNGNNSESLLIGGNVETLEQYSVSSTGIKKIEFQNPSALLDKGCFSSNTALTEVIIPDGLEYFCDSMFKGCTALTAITIPAGCSNVYANAFYGCTALKTVDFVGSPKLDKGCFSSCGVEKVVLREGMTDNRNVFSNCPNLREVVLTEGITVIGDSFFNRCKALESIVLPESLEVIKGGAFRSTGLKSVTVPANVKEIDGYLVADTPCEKVVFEGSLPLESNMFFNATKLTSIEFMGQYPADNSYTFNRCPLDQVDLRIHNATAFVGDGFTRYMSLIEDAETGIEYFEVTYITENGTEIPGRYAVSCSADTVVLGPKYVGMTPSTIAGKTVQIDPANKVFSTDGKALFAGSQLVSVFDTESYVIPEGIAFVSTGAFAACPSLRNVTVPASVENAGIGAFIDAAALEKVFLASSVPGLSFPETAKVYFQYGAYDADVCGDLNFAGYYLQLTTGRIVLENGEPTFTVDSVLSDSQAAFGITAVQGYTDSVIVLSVNGEPLALTSASDSIWIDGKRIDGMYCIPSVSGDVYVAVSGIQRNTYDVVLPSEEGCDIALSVPAEGIPYGTHAVLEVILKDGYVMDAGFKVLIDGQQPAYLRSTDRGVVIALDIVSDMNVQVVGVKQDTVFTVSFSSNGGSAVDTQSVPVNGHASAAVPVNGERFFMGWYTDSGLKNLYDFDTPVTSSITLYAKWADPLAETFKVTFATDSGSIVALANGSAWIKSGDSVPAGTVVRFYVHPQMNRDISTWTAGADVSKDSVTVKTYTVSAAFDLKVATEYCVSGTSSYRYDVPLFDEKDYVPLWTYHEGPIGGMGSTIPPAVLGDRIYFRALSDMVCIDAMTGKEIKRVDTQIGFSGFYAFVSAGNGLVIDGFGGLVFDRDLNQQFVLSEKNVKAYYHEDMIFVPFEGTIYAYSAVDQDPTVPDNVQTPVWSVSTGTFDSPYAGGSTLMFDNDYMMTVCIVGEDVQLKTVSIKDGSTIDTIIIPEFRGRMVNIGYTDLNEGYATLSVYGSDLFEDDMNSILNTCSVRISEEGVFNDITLKVVSTESGGKHISALTVMDGKGYIVANGYVEVWDMATMKMLAKSEFNSMYYGHNNMMVSNGTPGKVIGYMVSYNRTQDLFGFEYDIAGNSIRLFTLKDAGSYPQYSSGIARVTEEGNVIFYNDSNSIFCVAPAVDVTLRFNNGLEQTVTIGKGTPVVLDEGLVYEGVYTDSGMSAAFDLGTPITEDTVLYVKQKLTPSSFVIMNGSEKVAEYTGYVGGPVNGSLPGFFKTGYTAQWKDGTGKVVTQLPECFETEGTVTLTLSWVANSQTYTVKYVNQFGTEIAASEVLDARFGDVIASSGLVREIANHTFASASVQNLTVGAVDEKNVIVLNYEQFPEITWIVDGKETVSFVKTGETPVFDGTPAKEPTADRTYVFKEWSPAVVPVAGNAVYTAVFEEKVRQYTVSFYGEDGTTLFKAVSVDCGTAASVEGAPAKEQTAEFTYAFSAWLNTDGTPADLSSITADLSVKASYTEAVRQYTVTFQNEDGTVFRTVSVNYGTSGAIADVPAKASTAEYDFVFSKWMAADAEADLGSVTADMTVVASFASEARTYTVTYVAGNGEADTSAEAVFGSTVVLAAAPVRAHSVFLGWDLDGTVYAAGSEFEMPAADVVFEASWKAEVTSDDIVTENDDASVDVGSDTANISSGLASDMLEVPELNLELNFTGATLQMSVGTLGKLSKDSTGAVKDVSISVTTSDSAAPELVSKVSEKDLALLTYKLIGLVSVDVQGSGVTEGLGDVVITVPYELNGQDPANIVVNYVDETGALVPMSNVVYADGMLSFTTDHFSDFAISYVESAAADGSDEGASDVGSMNLIAGLIFGILIGAGALFVFIRVKN